jgi:putative addiction module component (TIGR02574 family)
MSLTLTELGIDQLSVEQRIALVQEILDSIVADQPPAPLSEAKRQELERRLAAHKNDPTDVIPWQQIETEALARFGE